MISVSKAAAIVLLLTMFVSCAYSSSERATLLRRNTGLDTLLSLDDTESESSSTSSADEKGDMDSLETHNEAQNFVVFPEEFFTDLLEETESRSEWRRLVAQGFFNYATDFKAFAVKKFEVETNKNLPILSQHYGRKHDAIKETREIQQMLKVLLNSGEMKYLLALERRGFKLRHFNRKRCKKFINQHLERIKLQAKNNISRQKALLAFLEKDVEPTAAETLVNAPKPRVHSKYDKQKN